MTGPIYRRKAATVPSLRSPPKVPRRPSRHASKADPTHEKLLAVLSQTSGIPDTETVGTASAAENLPVREDGTSEHLSPHRAFAHPKKCPVQ